MRMASASSTIDLKPGRDRRNRREFGAISGVGGKAVRHYVICLEGSESPRGGSWAMRSFFRDASRKPATTETRSVYVFRRT
jgi:hypothetical protein